MENVSKKWGQPIYSMKSKHRGVFIFVNIINFLKPERKREAAMTDRDRLIINVTRRAVYALALQGDEVFEERALYFGKICQKDTRNTNNLVNRIYDHLIPMRKILEHGVSKGLKKEWEKSTYGYIVEKMCTTLRGLEAYILPIENICVEGVEGVLNHERTPNMCNITSHLQPVFQTINTKLFAKYMLAFRY